MNPIKRNKNHFPCLNINLQQFKESTRCHRPLSRIYSPSEEEERKVEEEGEPSPRFGDGFIWIDGIFGRGEGEQGGRILTLDLRMGLSGRGWIRFLEVGRIFERGGDGRDEVREETKQEEVEGGEREVGAECWEERGVDWRERDLRRLRGQWRWRRKLKGWGYFGANLSFLKAGGISDLNWCFLKYQKEYFLLLTVD